MPPTAVRTVAFIYRMLLRKSMNETVSTNSDGFERDNAAVTDLCVSDWYVEEDVRWYTRLAGYSEGSDISPDMPPDEVLSIIGATVEKDGKIYPTEAGLLMFGKVWLITRRFGCFHLDYLEEVGDRRWDYRLTSVDACQELNVFRFLMEVLCRLILRLGVPFELDGYIRRGDSDVLIVVREALVNALVHAEYHMSGTVKAVYFGNRMVFANPGRSRVTIEEAREGGTCVPGNLVMLRMLQRIGTAKAEGSGIRSIFDAVENGTILDASVEEDSYGVVVEIAFVPLGRKPGDADMKVLRYVSENPNASIKEIASEMGVCPKTAGRILDGLAESGRLRNGGIGRRNLWIVGIRRFPGDHREMVVGETVGQVPPAVEHLLLNIVYHADVLEPRLFQHPDVVAGAFCIRRPQTVDRGVVANAGLQVFPVPVGEVIRHPASERSGQFIVEPVAVGVREGASGSQDPEPFGDDLLRIRHGPEHVVADHGVE